MRLIMLGTGPFAVPTLRALAAGRHEVALVVTRQPQGRRPTASPLQRAGEELSLTVWSPDSINTPESQARLQSLAADLLVVCDYGEILRPETLATTRHGGINLHGSLLPKYRGAAPVQWAILRGETETGLEDLRGLPAAIRSAGERGLQITRFKGLGEMNAEELRDTTLDPANRTLLQIRMDDASGADDLFRVLMGDQVEPRREFIQKHALDVRNLDV